MSRAWLYVLTQLPDCTAAGPLQRALLHFVLYSHVNPLMDSAIATTDVCRVGPWFQTLDLHTQIRPGLKIFGEMGCVMTQ